MLDEQVLDDLENQPPSRNLVVRTNDDQTLKKRGARDTFYAPTIIPRQDVVEVDRIEDLLKVRELKLLWKKADASLIDPLIWPKDRTSDEISALIDKMEDFLHAFENEIKHLSHMAGKKSKAITAIDKLIVTTDEAHTKAHGGSRKQQMKRREAIRQSANYVSTCLDNIERRIITPGLVNRWLERLWKMPKFVVSEEILNQVQPEVKMRMADIGVVLAKSMGLDREIISAFKLLDLPVTAARKDAEASFKERIRVLHPDLETGNEDKAAAMISAFEIVSDYISGKYGNSADDTTETGLDQADPK